MDTGFRPQCVPNYRLLTESQIQEIHLATLELLDTVGVRVLDGEAVELLRHAGCRVAEGGVVRIPNWLVEESIRSAPSRITIYNRDGEDAMHLEGNKVHFGLGTDLIKTYDLHTGELRPSRLEDVINAARTADYCEEIDFIASFALPQDVPTNMMYIACFKAMAENSVKPIFFTAAGYEDLSFIIEMAATVAGGEERLREAPFLIHYSEPTSPLCHSYGAVRKIFLCADNGIPINYTPGMLSGASGPVTLAGAITVANAEALSGIVLHQLRARGAPIISGFVATPMDMLSSTIVYGAPEFRLTHSAYADLYHYYRIPMWGTAGCSDAHMLDEQAAMESAVSILMAALDGANLVHDVGYLGQGLIGSPAAIVMCSEIIGYVKRFIRGFDIGRDRIGMEVIRNVGPGGNFLSEEQTARLHREEHWRPKFLNRDDPETWARKGGKSYGERVTQKALEILETYQPKPLSDEVCRTLDRIAQDAEKALREKHFVA
ncbi:MAG: trimethylamine methyltransferase family protein [Deltaproteobacteria bacterium]|nr:trimethylamine methyltransferase family protein [Deltaproteobacteria bacterium]